MKIIYLIWKSPTENFEKFAHTLQHEHLPAVLQHAVRSCTLNLVDVAPSAMARPRSDGTELGALVSLELAPHATLDLATTLAKILDPSLQQIAGYSVEEAIPVDYEKTWPNGERSPGVKQVTLLRRKPGLSDAEFLHRWHDVHTPLAMEIHPLWRYNRNVIQSAVTANAPNYEGIVELHIREKETLLDVMKFFGSPENIQRIAADVTQWIDMERIEVYNMSEYVLKSGCGCSH